MVKNTRKAACRWHELGTGLAQKWGSQVPRPLARIDLRAKLNVVRVGTQALEWVMKTKKQT
jgi:hypothetical protein